jgi:hypothetical protein
LSSVRLVVWKKLSEYSTDARAVGWNSRRAPRIVVTVGAKALGVVRPGTPPAAPGVPMGNGAGTFV